MSRPIIRRSFPSGLEIRATTGGGRTVSGVAVPYNTPQVINDYGSTFTEMFLPGAFARSIAERGDRVKILSAHDICEPIGKPTALYETPDALMVDARISDTDEGNEQLTLVADGVVDGFSVGFRVIQDATTPEGVRQIIEAALIEISLTAFPAYDGATVTGLRSLAEVRAEYLDLTDPTPKPATTLTLALLRRQLDQLELATP